MLKLRVTQHMIEKSLYPIFLAIVTPKGLPTLTASTIKGNTAPTSALL